RSCHQGSAAEPDESPARLGRSVEPGRQRDEQRQRAVHVVEPVGGPLALPDEDQTEADLGNDDGLGQREELSYDATRALAAAAGRSSSTSIPRTIRRVAPPRPASSVTPTTFFATAVPRFSASAPTTSRRTRNSRRSTRCRSRC